LLTRAEREARNAARQVDGHQRAQKAFHEDRARLKAERLERAASETGLKAKLKWMAA
jgi:hypothetical protein